MFWFSDFIIHRKGGYAILLCFKSCKVLNIRYKKETEVVTFQGREITLENLSPVFTPEQEATKRRELEQQLYEVFRKYAGKRQKEEAGA